MLDRLLTTAEAINRRIAHHCQHLGPRATRALSNQILQHLIQNVQLMRDQAWTNNADIPPEELVAIYLSIQDLNSRYDEMAGHDTSQGAASHHVEQQAEREQDIDDMPALDRSISALLEISQLRFEGQISWQTWLTIERCLLSRGNPVNEIPQEHNSTDIEMPFPPTPSEGRGPNDFSQFGAAETTRASPLPTNSHARQDISMQEIAAGMEDQNLRPSTST